MHPRRHPAAAAGQRWIRLVAALALAVAVDACTVLAGSKGSPGAPDTSHAASPPGTPTTPVTPGTTGAPGGGGAGGAGAAGAPTSPAVPPAPATAGPPASPGSPSAPGDRPPVGASGGPTQPWRVAPSGELRRPLMPDRSLEPPANEVPVLFAYGQGVQRYVCKEKERAKGSYAWVLKEPQAKLADTSGHEIGTHSAGPSWQLADGSKAVRKTLVASVPALASDAVPWLLLSVDASGKGGIADAEYVQRVDTVGGAAPADGCDAAHAGATRDVEYRATYVFYARRKSR
jgi:Protein of unknown function (DUF3455)